MNPNLPPSAAVPPAVAPAKPAGLQPFLPALALLCLAVAYRIGLAWMTTHGNALPAWLPGFCPLAALALGSGWFLPRRLALGAPLAVLLLSDLALTALYGWQPLGGSTWEEALLEMATRYGVLFMLAAWALRLRRGRQQSSAQNAVVLLGATVAGSLGFYLITNTVSWLTLAGYAHTLTGWWQALSTGLPGYPPSWIFFRNALVSDVLYSILLLAAFRLARPAQAAAVLTPASPVVPVR